MRYYDLIITNPSGKILRQWTTHPNGKLDIGALNVEFDLNVYPGHIPGGDNNSITISGISLQDLAQDTDFANNTLSLYGGMKAGLPLANPAQSGLLVQGSIYQSYGNWVGTDMTLTFVVTGAAPNGPDTVLNFSGVWQKGQPLSAAIAQTLKNALPGVKQNISISNQLVATTTETWGYSTFAAFASQIQDMTILLLGDTYPGVMMTYRSGAIYVTDQTAPLNTVQINFVDLVGQPTWIGPNQMLVQTILRADISVGDSIKMPQGLFSQPGSVSTTAASTPSSIKYKSTFAGNFVIQQARHVGSSRDPSGLSWISNFICTPGPAS